MRTADFDANEVTGNDIALADSDDDATPDSLKRAAPLPELLTSSEPLQQAELHWRLAAPLSVVILALLAVPLARTRPREARYASLLVALLGYLVYLGWLGLARSFIEQGKVPPALGLWWVHLPAAAVALWLLRRSARNARQADHNPVRPTTRSVTRGPQPGPRDESISGR